ncbi:MAG TPA: radical SAM protein [Gemmatimonadaceae bacterium]|nr:radical SAM protein [Gemmatimonadaceae bacterium]
MASGSTKADESPRRGLLIYPEFPDSAFWSYRHILSMIDRKAAFPPLGLLTFASLMPEHWSFELIDLNVTQPDDEELRERIASVDAVFVSAMSVQKRSLVDVLRGPALGLDTPWVLGGAYPSSYRDQILHPQTESDRVLHGGLDLLVWGEGGQWVESIDRFLHRGRRHSDATPELFVPEAIAAQAPGSRRALNDRSIFKELGRTPPPRWDLVNIADYRALMIQTTVGCRFRCDFCDIIQFNGGFTRPKTLESVREELEVLYALGYRGGIFTVDDNFVGSPTAIEAILRVMSDFQRRHDYPFSFYTQASLDLGTPKLRHLLPLMKEAGFDSVFLGIENPDPAALRGMNKKQNTMVDIAQTVATMQAAGIEVMAGFIFGGDEDTPETADAIATFATATAIPSAMTGMLTPVPHTPLSERLRSEGRLREAEYSGNNTDDEVQFLPRRMSVGEMQDGYYAILERLFSARAMYRRSGALLDRLRPHIFRSAGSRREDVRVAMRSLWRQGVMRRERGEYFRLLLKAARLDRRHARDAARRVEELERRLRSLGHDARQRFDGDIAVLAGLVDHAREAMIRADPARTIDEIREWASSVERRLHERSATADDLRALYEWSREFFIHRWRVHRFPGACINKAFQCAIKGLHFEMAMTGIIERHRRLGGDSEGDARPERLEAAATV